MLAEAVVTAEVYHLTPPVPGNVLAVLCPSGIRDKSAFQSIEPMFVIGVCLTVLGGCIRLWTYQVLGQLFTFQVAVRSSHKLITSAPYSVVRHPGYSALFIHTFGMLTTVFRTGGWAQKCGLMETPALIWLLVWTFALLFASVSIWRRGDIEDNVLSKKFGDEWTVYSRRVPHKFFPGLV